MPTGLKLWNHGSANSKEDGKVEMDLSNAIAHVGLRGYSVVKLPPFKSQLCRRLTVTLGACKGKRGTTHGPYFIGLFKRCGCYCESISCVVTGLSNSSTRPDFFPSYLQQVTSFKGGKKKKDDTWLKTANLQADSHSCKDDPRGPIDASFVRITW
jgi:hypothetical protein